MTTNVTELLKAAYAESGNAAALLKNATFVSPTSATTGLQMYDLEPAAKNLYPVLTPLRNRIPRVTGVGGIQANWKSVTAIDSGMITAGVPEGRRGAIVGVTTKEYMAAYRTIGSESAVTFEAELAANTFDDLRARASTTALQTLMMAEERLILGGNTSFALGVTPAATLSQSASGGSLGAATYSVIVVALTLDGLRRASVGGGVIPTITRTAADGTPDTMAGGVGQKSTNATIVVAAGAANSLTAKITPVRGAVGYAWYWGTAANEVLGAVTTSSQAIITGAATGTQTAASLPSADNSTDQYVFDGLLTMASNASNGGYYNAAAAGVGLTGDGANGIVEFDAALQWFWDNLRLSPTKILISSSEMLYIRKKLLAGSTPASAVRFTFAGNQNGLTGGGIPRGYVNPFAASAGMDAAAEIPFELHPNMPAGTVLFVTESLPYPVNNIGNVMQIRARKDYYQIDWPQRTRQYEFGVYSDEVFQHYFPPSLGLITNLAAA